MPFRYRSARWKMSSVRRYNKRQRAASRIGRAWRRRKRTYKSSAKKTSNIRIGHRAGRLTLKKRVARLEISAKKHYDYVNTRALGVPIEVMGAANGTTTQESFSQMLAVQPRNFDGTIPPVSGSARGTERNTREGMEIFCTKVRLRGRIMGIRPNTTDELKNCLYEFTDSVTGTVHSIGPQDKSLQMQSACQSRVHIVVCSDKRPSTIDPVTGSYEPNPLPNIPQNVLQGFYQPEGLTANNTLDSMGLDAALRNYTNNRFKVVHSSTLQFDWSHPSKWFDISISVNKKLVFEPPDPALPAQPNTDPVNYNLVYFVSSVPSETRLAASNEFIMNDVTTTPYTPVNLLLQPNLSMMSSRTYFRET